MSAIATLFGHVSLGPISGGRRNPFPRRLSSSLHSQSMTTGGGGGEEVEVKIKLPDSHSHRKLTSLLSPFHVTTHLQENFFFDSPAAALASRRSALRLRFYDSDLRAVLSLKSSPSITLGVSRANELELDVDPLSARACVSDPGLLGRLGPAQPNRVIERVREIVGDEEAGELICLGGFKNVRNVFDWKGLNLEADETLFDFGTSYEIECESDTPLQAKSLIEELLVGNGIPFSYSKASKFAVFRAGKLPLSMGRILLIYSGYEYSYLDVLDPACAGLCWDDDDDDGAGNEDVLKKYVFPFLQQLTIFQKCCSLYASYWFSAWAAIVLPFSDMGVYSVILDQLYVIYEEL